MVEGMVAEVVSACAGGAVLTGWALYLGCGPLLIGILGALNFFAQFVQFPAAWLSSRLGYRKVAIVSVSVSRQLLLPLIALPWLPIAQGSKQAVLMGVAAISALLGVVGNNAWTAWMGELVPKRIRGRYFGRRAALCALGNTSAALAAGVLLDRARLPGLTGAALAALALAACVAGAVTTVLMCRQHDPTPDGGRGRFDLRATLLPLRDPRGRRVLTFQLLWNTAIGASSALFSLHMLQNLKMGFALMALYNAGLAFMRILAAPLWGRALDRVGARTVLTFCSLGMTAAPVIWLFPKPWMLWPLLVDVLFSGALWGGHQLASFALPLSVAPREGRPFYLAAFATAAGLSYAAAATAGGYLAQRAPVQLTVAGFSLYGLQLVFLVSGAFRLTAALSALRIHEAASRPLPELVALVWAGAIALPLRIARLPGRIALATVSGGTASPSSPAPRARSRAWPLPPRQWPAAAGPRAETGTPSRDPGTASRTG